MEVLLNKIKKLKDIDINPILIKILSDKSFQKWILDLIRIEQLYNKGIRGDGQELGRYTPLSLTLKTDPMISHITLKETGEFYNTFNITLNADSFIVDGDSGDKLDKLGFDLFERFDNFEGDLLGLTDENMQLLIDKLSPLILDEIWNTI